MRRFVVSTLTSLDGYQAGRGGDLSVLPFDEGFSRYNLERLRTASTLLLGRRFFEGFWAYWSSVAEDASAPAVEREIAGLNLPMEKVVVSDTLRHDPAAPWAATTRVVRIADAPEAVAALKQEDGGDLLMFGSPTTWNPLLERGLVDEVHVLVGPALLGDGVKLFAGERAPLRLLESRPLPDSQLVLLRYAAVTAAG
jgi:dihydrofolate reductase